MGEKIKEWEQEIEKIKESERSMIENNKKRIQSLKKKIDDAKILEEREHNRMIASIVKEFYGDVTVENIEQFKERMKSLGNSIQGMNERM